MSGTTDAQTHSTRGGASLSDCPDVHNVGGASTQILSATDRRHRITAGSLLAKCWGNRCSWDAGTLVEFSPLAHRVRSARQPWFTLTICPTKIFIPGVWETVFSVFALVASLFPSGSLRGTVASPVSSSRSYLRLPKSIPSTAKLHNAVQPVQKPAFPFDSVSVIARARSRFFRFSRTSRAASSWSCVRTRCDYERSQSAYAADRYQR